jgi:L-ascorbate 6-phosphate lactonase
MGFALRGPETIVYVDLFLNPTYQDEWVTRAVKPAFAPDTLRQASLVLASHEHADHCDPIALRAIAEQTTALFAGPSPSCEIARAAGFPSARIRVLRSGQSLSVGKAEVTALASEDHLAKAALIYVIDTEGIRIVHAGDSLQTRSFDDIGQAGGTDVAILATARNPLGRVWYLQPDELMTAARRLRTRLVVPGHWDLWRQLAWRPDQLMTMLGAQNNSPPVVLLPVGRYLMVSRVQSGAELTWSVASSDLSENTEM